MRCMQNINMCVCVCVCSYLWDGLFTLQHANREVGDRSGENGSDYSTV